MSTLLHMVYEYRHLLHRRERCHGVLSVDNQAFAGPPSQVWRARHLIAA